MKKKKIIQLFALIIVLLSSVLVSWLIGYNMGGKKGFEEGSKKVYYIPIGEEILDLKKEFIFED